MTIDLTGQTTTRSRGNSKLGELRPEGVDLSVGHRLPKTAFGSFALRAESTYLDQYSIRSTATADFYNYAGEYGYFRVKSNTAVDVTTRHSDRVGRPGLNVAVV